jgi:glutamate-1-semialdehyde 2,1-aminomutase
MSAVAIDRDRLAELTADELESFRERNPASRALSARAQPLLLGGVPMNWMNKWASAHPIAGAPGAFPIFARRAQGARVTDVDGHDYIDFCLGDSGAMTGHSPPQVKAALRSALADGLTYMLPTAASIEAADALSERFAVERWQFTVSATDANRFAIRLARAITGRSKILVFNHCYHGTVDETLATLDGEGNVVARPFNLGPPVPVAQTTRVVEFNDIAALQRELACGDVACVLAEPALTNVGIVLPADGFHDALRALTREHQTLLILDETHTLSASWSGFCGLHGLSPDILTVGKAIASGIPAGAYGLSSELASRVERDGSLGATLTEGIGSGGTLAGNALTAAAIKVTLREVLTPAAHRHMLSLGERWALGVREVIARFALPWHVTQLGGRAEYHFHPRRPANGSELAAAGDEALERYLRLSMINRGILTTPFHNMALMCPLTTAEDVDRHTAALDQAIAQLFSAASPNARVDAGGHQ